MVNRKAVENKSFVKRWCYKLKNILMSQDLQRKFQEFQLNQSKYVYESDTENEEAYVTPQNASFKKWREEKQNRHIIKLWKAAYNRAVAASLIINL